MAKADLDKKPFDVVGMFDDVGKNYDTTNTVLSFGRDKYWRRRTRERLGLKPGELVLDLAAGAAGSRLLIDADAAGAGTMDGRAFAGAQFEPLRFFFLGDADARS